MSRPKVTQVGDVLDAAAERLASHGVSGTTIDDVAAAAGVSRATVYRYVGGKDDIVQAVLAREAEGVLAQLELVIGSAPTVDQAIARTVATSLDAIAERPLLARLTTSDLEASLPFITVASAALMQRIVATLSTAFRDAPGFEVDVGALDDVLEEATRFVLLHITTPRRDGARLSAPDAGARAAELYGSLLDPAG